MATDVRLAPIHADTTDGTIARWLVKPGDIVDEGQVLVEVDTAKVLVEVPSPTTGTVLALHANEGDDVVVGQLLVVIGDPHERPATSAPLVAASRPPVATPTGSAAAPTDQRDVRAAPAVRRLAQRLGVDLTMVTATGPHGRVMLADLKRADQAHHTPQAAGTGSLPPQQHSRIRRTISASMTSTWRDVPHFSTSLEVDTSACDDAAGAHGFMAVLVRSVALCLVDDPILNATYDDARGVTRYATANIGVAVALDDGLVVPVLRRCERLLPAELRISLGELTQRARAGRLSEEDVTGHSFVISNVGMTGVDTVIPIVHRPAVAILGVGARRRRPWSVGDALTVRPTVRLTLSCDHRAVDGMQACRWLVSLGRALGDPG
jgi:pyruvate dehydrogenase E2 component (dihydrolipoamide acetyltransferase)